MENTQLTANAQTLNREMQWLIIRINARLQHYFKHTTDQPDIHPAPSLEGDESPYAAFVIKHKLSIACLLYTSPSPRDS